MKTVLNIFKIDNHFEVSFSGRKFEMDELELAYFLNHAFRGVGEFRAQKILEAVKADDSYTKEHEIDLDRIPGIYMRTQ